MRPTVSGLALLPAIKLHNVPREIPDASSSFVPLQARALARSNFFLFNFIAYPPFALTIKLCLFLNNTQLNYICQYISDYFLNLIVYNGIVSLRRCCNSEER